MPKKKPLYIAFEGGEGGGKSTQARALSERIGETAIFTFEPGNTIVGARIRGLLLDPETGAMEDIAEAFLMAADRAEHIARVVRPHLSSGGHVISDRTFISSIAYQGAARGLGEDKVMGLNLLNSNLILPDLVIIMRELPKDEKIKRMMNAGATLDRIEAAGDHFHNLVAESFSRMGDTLAADSRTASIKTVYIDQIESGEVKNIRTVHEEVCQRVIDFCQDNNYASPI